MYSSSSLFVLFHVLQELAFFKFLGSFNFTLVILQFLIFLDTHFVDFFFHKFLHFCQLTFTCVVFFNSWQLRHYFLPKLFKWQILSLTSTTWLANTFEIIGTRAYSQRVLRIHLMEKLIFWTTSHIFECMPLTESFIQFQGFGLFDTAENQITPIDMTKISQCWAQNFSLNWLQRFCKNVIFSANNCNWNHHWIYFQPLSIDFTPCVLKFLLYFSKWFYSWILEFLYRWFYVFSNCS